MYRCDACGGDGQIEYGAYRGEKDGPTRECRLCGGVVAATAVGTIYPISAGQVGVVTSEISFKDERGQKRISRETAPIERLAHLSSRNGVRTPDLTVSTARTPQDIAREYAERLNAENKRQQREAEAGARGEFRDERGAMRRIRPPMTLEDT